MEKQAKPRSGNKGSRGKTRRRGSKNNKLTIDESKILKPDHLPEGSTFKGYEDYIVQDLILRPWTGAVPTATLADAKGRNHCWGAAKEY